MYNGILIEYDHHVPIGILVLLNFNGPRVTQGSRACLAAPSPAPSPQVQVPSKEKCRTEQHPVTLMVERGSSNGDTLIFQHRGGLLTPKKVPGARCAGGCCEVCCGMDFLNEVKDIQYLYDSIWVICHDIS